MKFKLHYYWLVGKLYWFGLRNGCFRLTWQLHSIQRANFKMLLKHMETLMPAEPPTPEQLDRWAEMHGLSVVAGESYEDQRARLLAKVREQPEEYPDTGDLTHF